MRYLKEKRVASGNAAIITQMFLDAQVLLGFAKTCKDWDIGAPVIPGIICLDTYGRLERMTALCRARVPEGMMRAAKAANTSDEATKDWGIELGVEMCRKLIDGGVGGLRFYTLNLEKVVLGVLHGLGLTTAEQAKACSGGEADAKSMVPAQGITTEKPAARPTAAGDRPLQGG